MATTDLDRTRTTLPPATPSGNDGVSPRAVLAGIGGLAILIGPFVFVSQWAISFLFDVESVGPEYLPSISHAFHSPVAKPFFVAMLGAAALMFMAYRGWTTRSPGADRALAILCSASGCLVVLFPTSPCPMPATGVSELWPDYVKAFQVVHFSAASTLFIALILIARCRFIDSSGGDENFKAWKRVRNGVYRCCSNIMIAAVVGMVVCGIIEYLRGTDLPFLYVLIGEWVALSGFGVAWLVKGQFLLAYSGGLCPMPRNYAEQSSGQTNRRTYSWLSSRPQACSVCVQINSILDSLFKVLGRFR